MLKKIILQKFGKKLPISLYKYLIPKFPDSIQLEITTKCNLSCSICPRHTFENFNPNGVMPMATYNKILKDAKSYLKSVYLWGVGEPLMHPDFFEMVSTAKAMGLKVIFTTNAILLTKEVSEKIVELGVDEVIVSLDGASLETVERIRGCNLDVIFSNIAELNLTKKSQNKKYPKLSINFIVLKSNVKEAIPVLSVANIMEVDRVKFQNMLTWNEENANDALITNARLNQLDKILDASKKVKIKVQIPNRELTEYPKCLQPWIGAPNVTYDGTVTPCCFVAYPLDTYFIRQNGKIIREKTHFAPIELGNVYFNTIVEIWNNVKYRELRESFLNKSPQHPCDICLNQDGVVC